MRIHLHWFVVVRETQVPGNYYAQCRCGDRKIFHRYRNHMMDYSWLKTGKFSGYGFIPVRSEPFVPPKGRSGVGQ